MTGFSKVFSPLLERHPVLSSRDVDEARALLRGSHDRFDVERSPPGEFFLTIYGVRAGEATVALVRSGAPVRTRQSAALDAYTILLPLRRSAEITVGGKSIVCEPHHAAITSPGREQCISAERKCDRLWVSIGRTALTQTAAALLGEGLAEPVEFKPEIDLAAQPNRSLFNTIAFAASELSGGGSAFYNPVLRKDLEELIVGTLLLTQEHNFSDRFERCDRCVSPKDVRVVVDYIHANLHAPITLGELVAVSGVPGRTLRHHFRRFVGMSPLSYLRQVRFARVRDELLRGEENLRITDVATSHGFDHLGRFSLGYRQRYGESPSRTAAASQRSGGVTGWRLARENTKR
jgi:AraC-like DNA-binding protein